MTGTTLIEDMERTWRELAKYQGPPPAMLCFKGLWFRIDGMVSDDAQTWRHRTEADQALADTFTRPDPAPLLPIEPVRPAPTPCWHQHRGSRTR